MPSPTSPFGEPRVVVAPIDGDRFAHLAWPKVVRTRQETIVLAFSAGRFHGAHGEGCPAIAVSNDRGETFSPPQIVTEFTADDTYTHCGNLALGVTTDDTLILMAMAYRGDEANSLFSWVSIDQGESWQESNVSALAAGRTGSVYGSVFKVDGRGYSVAGHFREGSYPDTQGIWMSTSDDGLHWKAPEKVTDRPLVEPAFVAMEENIIGLARPNTDRYEQIVANRRRMDWKVGESGVTASGPNTQLPCPTLFRVGDRLVSLVTERTVPGNAPGRIIAWSADLEGAAWKRGQTLIEFPADEENNDFGYPWMIPLDDDRWWCTFYQGRNKGACSIYGIHLDPSVLIE